MCTSLCAVCDCSGETALHLLTAIKRTTGSLYSHILTQLFHPSWKKKQTKLTNKLIFIDSADFFVGEMTPGQYSRKRNNLHLYACYQWTLSFHLASVNLNYNFKVQSLFTERRVGTGGGGG